MAPNVPAPTHVSSRVDHGGVGLTFAMWNLQVLSLSSSSFCLGDDEVTDESSLETHLCA